MTCWMMTSSLFVRTTKSLCGRRFLSTTKSDIRWGILSAGKISSDYAKAIAITDGAEVGAVAARSYEKAQLFAQEHDIPNVKSYDDLLHDPSIDVIYVGSIADQHYPLAVKSLLAKKPTVVEKPFTLNFQDTEKLVKLASQHNVFLMEGMWTRCFPATRTVRQLISENTIGKVVTIQGDFGWSTQDCGPNDRIWEKRSGGMTLDIGMYMIQLGQVGFAGMEPTRVQAMGSFRNGVDHTVLANVQYGESGFLQFTITGDANTEERVVIQGTKGRIIMEPPAHVPTKLKLQLDQGRGIVNEKVLDFPLPDDSYTTWNYPGSIGFTHQIQAVGEALREGELECRHYTHYDSLQVASIMDQILQQVHEQNEEISAHDNNSMETA